MFTYDDIIQSVSPDGRYQLRTGSWDPRMSIWLYPPEIFDVQTQQVIFRVRDIAWTLDHSAWEGDSVLSISLCKYPDPETRLNVRINCADKMAKINNYEKIELKALGHALEKAHAALAATLNANPAG